jgi:hypothetical protein
LSQHLYGRPEFPKLRILSRQLPGEGMRAKEIRRGSHPIVLKMTITETGKTFRVSAMPSADREFIGPRVLCRRLCALLFLTTCAGCCNAGPIFSASQPNVIVLRAMAGYFPCLSNFEEQLLEDGICPTVAYAGAHQEITERIVAAKNNGRLQGPLVIVGYSAGADKALVVARRLGECGIEVDKLVLVEPSKQGCVPANVRECLNIYKPQLWTEFVPFFRGCIVTAENPSTQLLNYNVRDYNDGRYDWDNHFTLTMNPYLRDFMVDEVLSAVDGVPEQEDVPSEQADVSAADESEEFHAPTK